jgi:hypothetical protein
MAYSVPQVRKAVVALVGFAVIAAATAGVELGADVDDTVVGVFDAVVALLVAAGVFKATNSP